MEEPRDKIRISNLSTATSHSKISHMFRKFGETTKVYIQCLAATWDCSGQAYVAFTDAQSAANAVESKNGEIFDESIMSVELVSDSEYHQHVKTMPTSSSIDGAIKSRKRRTKVPAKTKLTPKDIALAPNSEWEPYIPPTTTQYVPNEDPAPKNDAPRSSSQPPPPGATPTDDSPFPKRELDNSALSGDNHREAKYNPQDRDVKQFVRSTHKSTSEHNNRFREWNSYDSPSIRGDSPYKNAAGDRLGQRSLREDRRSLGSDPYRDLVDRDLLKSLRTDHCSDRSRDHRSHPRSDRELPLCPLLLKQEYEDDLLLIESDLRHYDRYDLLRSRDYEYDRLPPPRHREHSPSRHLWDSDHLPSASKRRAYPDDYSEVLHARLYDDDPLRREPYPRDPHPRDDRRDLDPREERLYREPVRDGYREADRMDDRYSFERDRADAREYDNRGRPDDLLYPKPKRASSQEPRSLGIDRPTYDYSLESTLGADRPTYDYSL